jgi:hypothetical protein
VARDFDPYYKWLGIPPKDQPPNHYRLLGVELFEPDREVIDAAASRIMAYLKSLATGDDAEHSQKLLNEVAAARQCLLNPAKKAAYDAQLQSGSRTADSAVPPEPPPVTPAPPPPLAVTPPAALPRAPLRVGGAGGAPAPRGPSRHVSPKEAERASKDFTTAVWLVAGGAAALVIVLLLITAASDRKPRKRPATSHPRPSPAVRHEANEPRTHRSQADAGKGLLSIEWPVSERADAVVSIDHDPKNIPPQVLVEYSLPPGEHELVIQRDGYETLRYTFSLREGDVHEYRLRWHWLGQGGRSSEADWPKKEARQEQPSDRPPPPPRQTPKEPATRQPPPEATPPKPPQSERSDPLRDVPRASAIPTLPQDNEHPDGRVRLAKIDCEPKEPWQLELRGGDQPMKKFFLVQTGQEPAKAAWTVRLEQRLRDAPSRLSDVARLVRQQGELWFEWLPEAAGQPADDVQSYLLHIAVADKQRDLALVKPKQVEPLVVDLQRLPMRRALPLKWRPAPQALMIAVTKVEGRDGYRIEGTPPGSTVSFLRKDAADRPEVQLQLSILAQDTLACVCRLANPPLEDFRNYLPVKKPAMIGRKHPVVEKFNKESLLKQQAECRENLGKARKEEERAGPQARLEQINRELWFLEFYDAVHNKAKIHFRVFFKIGDREVELACSEPSP